MPPGRSTPILYKRSISEAFNNLPLPKERTVRFESAPRDMEGAVRQDGSELDFIANHFDCRNATQELNEIKGTATFEELQKAFSRIKRDPKINEKGMYKILVRVLDLHAR
jgi:hypothetical protein